MLNVSSSLYVVPVLNVLISPFPISIALIQQLLLVKKDLL